MGGRGAASGAKSSIKSSKSSAAVDYTAKSLPTDTARVENLSFAKSEIGIFDGDVIAGIVGTKSKPEFIADKDAYNNYERYQLADVTIKAKPIEGVSEKQIAYAESVRSNVIHRIVESKYREAETQRQKMGAEKWEEGLKTNGFNSYSEFLAHGIASYKTVGELVNETSARNILDKYR